MEYSLTNIYKNGDNKQKGLNPCCNGILPDHVPPMEHYLRKSVLILVVMEYSLTKMNEDEILEKY